MPTRSAPIGLVVLPDEQPFTRQQSNVEIPDSVDEVTIEGRDQANGFGGGTVTVDLSDART